MSFFPIYNALRPKRRKGEGLGDFKIVGIEYQCPETKETFELTAKEVRANSRRILGVEIWPTKIDCRLHPGEQHKAEELNYLIIRGG